MTDPRDYVAEQIHRYGRDDAELRIGAWVPTTRRQAELKAMALALLQFELDSNAKLARARKHASASDLNWREFLRTENDKPGYCDYGVFEKARAARAKMIVAGRKRKKARIAITKRWADEDRSVSRRKKISKTSSARSSRKC